MNYKGNYDAGTEYAKGDVVIYTDGVPYYLQKAAPAGTTPHDVRSWNRVPQPFSEVVVMFHEALSKVPKNIDDEGITLKDVDDNEYMITVDASGDTPELAVTLIEESES